MSRYSTKKKVCQNCGEEYHPRKDIFKTSKYCSRGCSYKGLLKDIAGERFGKLTVLKQSGRNKHKQILWRCLCECGGIAVVDAGKLKSGHTKSCGCLRGQGKGAVKAAPEFKEDLSGKKFGRLTALSFAANGNSGETRFYCLCECGKKSVVSRLSLLRGTTISCGCYHKDKMKMQTGEKNPSYKHGLTRNHRLWDTFHHMKGRCYRPGDKSFPSYGGRGIAVCKIWRNNIERFFSWAIRNGYQDDFEIDRINNNGPYAPWNCQFISGEDNKTKMHSQRDRWMPR